MESRSFHERLEPQRQAIAIWPILWSAWPVQDPPIQSLERFEHGPVGLREEAFGNMNPVVWIDTDQMGVERRMVDFGKRDSIGHDRMPEPLVLVRDDMGCIQQQRFR